MNKLKQTIISSLINYKGFKTKRKIVVFESDDWGSIRMPSVEVFNKLKKAGIPVEKSSYCKFDSLESNTDLEMLFEVLMCFKDEHGNHPIITANTVVANPDFEKIKASEFNEYHYEPFTETLTKYPNHNKVFDYYKLGIKEGIFFPQFHGREHVNVVMWLNLLKENNPDFLLAFENNMWGLSNDIFPKFGKSIQATFDSNNHVFLENSIQSGLALFEQLFGYKSESFIANNFIWDSNLNNILNQNGVKHLQGMKYQLLPLNELNSRKKIRHFQGEKNSYLQTYSIRNCGFELTENAYGIKKTLADISNAFFWNKPAIISTHRLNFMGELNEKNRKENLLLFKTLLYEILKKWSNVEFMNTIQLRETMINLCVE